MNRPVHFEILADDPQKISEFYKSALGWEISTWDGPQSYWMVKTGDANAQGINGGIMERHFPQAVINTCYVESLKDTTAKIEAGGGKRVSEPSEVPGVGLHAYFADPEGNLFGLMQPNPE